MAAKSDAIHRNPAVFALTRRTGTVCTTVVSGSWEAGAMMTISGFTVMAAVPTGLMKKVY